MRLLIIEDNKDLCDAICFQLHNEGYITDVCYTGENALFYALQKSYDIIILDRMLPELDGLSILKAIRKNNINIPIIIITAMDGLHDRVDGLDSGADDYLVKPFAMEELLARIRALARRPQKIEQIEQLSFADMILDTKNQTLSTSKSSCSLSRRETSLLEIFMRNSNQILAREVILSYVWGPDNFVEEGNLDNYIHFLRRRFDSISTISSIKTIHRVGYRLES
jgi:DNA-binding response OmpR family regulator